MNRFEKAAYGGDDEYGEYDRWADGGPAWGLNKQKMIDLTRLFTAEAARRKAQLLFHADRDMRDMFTPEEAIKRISAAPNDKDLDDVENLPNYYSLQYPLKPRSGILETLRLKSPGPIDDWGPEGNPMEAVNRSLMGMRSRSGSLKKAAAFGAMMGKRAAYATPSNFSAGDHHVDLNGPNPVPDDPTQGFARFAPINNPPAAGTFPGNSGPSMGARDPMSGPPRAQGTLQQWMTPPTGTPAPSRLKQFMKQPENPPMSWAERQGIRTGTYPPPSNSIEAMRRASWTPEQHQENREYEAHRISEAQEKEKQDYRAQTPDWEYRRGGPKYGQDTPHNLAPQYNHSIVPDNTTMMGLASMGTGYAAGGLTSVAGGGGLGGGFSDATALAKSFIPKGEGTAKYLTGIGKASLPYTDPTGLGKSLVAGAEGATGTTLASRGLTAAMEAAKYKGLSEVKSLTRAGGPQTPLSAYADNHRPRSHPTSGTSMAGEPETTPGNRTVGEPQTAPGTNTVGKPQTRPMTGTIPNVPRG